MDDYILNLKSLFFNLKSVPGFGLLFTEDCSLLTVYFSLLPSTFQLPTSTFLLFYPDAQSCTVFPHAIITYR